MEDQASITNGSTATVIAFRIWRKTMLNDHCEESAKAPQQWKFYICWSRGTVIKAVIDAHSITESWCCMAPPEISSPPCFGHSRVSYRKVLGTASSWTSSGFLHLLGQSVLVCNHPKSKNVFSCLNFLWFGFCPLGTSLDTAEKSLSL